MVSETWALFRSTQATAASLPLRLVEIYSQGFLFDDFSPISSSELPK